MAVATLIVYLARVVNYRTSQIFSKYSNGTYIVETAENAILNELSSYIRAVKSIVKEDNNRGGDVTF